MPNHFITCKYANAHLVYDEIVGRLQTFSTRIGVPEHLVGKMLRLLKGIQYSIRRLPQQVRILYKGWFEIGWEHFLKGRMPLGLEKLKQKSTVGETTRSGDVTEESS